MARHSVRKWVMEGHKSINYPLLKKGLSTALAGNHLMHYLCIRGKELTLQITGSFYVKISDMSMQY